MYMSHDEFEGYLAKQKAETVQIVPAKKMSPKTETILGYLVGVVPLVIVLAAFGLWSQSTNMKQVDRTATWDKILGATAAATGFEYDADAETLEERLRSKGNANPALSLIEMNSNSVAIWKRTKLQRRTQGCKAEDEADRRHSD